MLKAESKRTGDKTIGRDKPGRPKVEELKLNEGLLEFYKILAKEFVVGTTDERRRSDLIISCTSLDDLLKVVQDHGYTISRSAFYLRFHPLRSNTHQGKAHYKLLPIKFAKPQNVARKRHPGIKCSSLYKEKLYLLEQKMFQ